ncbi:hypothetical protein HY498_00490 [Candidatus Woesearchaeota archaeon]|nr:hypothetical protein [Candidatus Woesearchaeota archaeon]
MQKGNRSEISKSFTYFHLRNVPIEDIMEDIAENMVKIGPSNIKVEDIVKSFEEGIEHYVRPKTRSKSLEEINYGINLICLLVHYIANTSNGHSYRNIHDFVAKRIK